MSLQSLIEQEGWKLVKQQDRNHKDVYKVQTPYESSLGLLVLKHPSLLHLEIYRKHNDPGTRYQHLKKARDMFWPNCIYHEWTRRRFQTFCEPWNYITLAAGASTSKSFDVAQYAVLFWYANPRERNVTVASVTLSSLMTRVWGYLTAHIKNMDVQLPYKYYRSTPPRILFEEPAAGKNKVEDDTLHGIFAVTAKVGDDDQAVSTWIGKHPKDKILLILDEATDMPMSILNALPNLNSHPDKFQLIAIGNSNSTNDLHGLLSTPKNGWDSVSTDLTQWDTTQPRGTCLYFSPYESPAITDPDPVKRKALSLFLYGEDNLRTKEKELGVDTEQFYRWVLGFWKSRSTENTTVSGAFLKDFDPRAKPEWSGYYPITRIAGLDPAFSTGGDKCVLRIAAVGHSYDLKVKIDLNLGLTMFDIKIQAIVDKSVEMQIAKQVIEILKKYSVSLDHLAVDCTGQGRAIGEVIKLENSIQGYPLGYGAPMKIYSMGQHNVNKKTKSVPDLTVISSHELWNTMRQYIEQGQVVQLDEKTIHQLTSRLIVTANNGAQKLESKDEYKRRMAGMGQGHSPDEADATALCFQVMRKRLGIEPGTQWKIPEVEMDSHNEKMRLYLLSLEKSGSGEGSGGSANTSTIEADFSGGLDNYLEYKRPF